MIDRLSRLIMKLNGNDKIVEKLETIDERLANMEFTISGDRTIKVVVWDS